MIAEYITNRAKGVKMGRKRRYARKHITAHDKEVDKENLEKARAAKERKRGR